MKNVAISSFVLILIVGIIVLKEDSDFNNSFNNADQWTTFVKQQDKIISQPSTAMELKKIGADKAKKSSLIPKRSLSSVQISPKNYKTFKGRRILGNVNNKNQNLAEMNFINSTADDWKEKLSEKLLKHRERKAKLFIRS